MVVAASHSVTDLILRRRAVALFAILTVALLAMCPIVTAESVVDIGDDFRETVTVPDGGWRAYRAALSSVDSITISVQVTQGGSIDVYTTNEFGFGAYRDPNATTFPYYPAGSIQNKTSFQHGFTPPTGGTYFVIVDNAATPSGGATPKGPVTVDVRLERRSLLPIVAGILASIVAVAVILVWTARRRRRRKVLVRKGESPPPPNQ